MTATPVPSVLYVTAGFPFPLSTGYLRHHHLLSRLASDHRIHLMSLAGPSFEPGHAQVMSEIVDAVSTFARPAGQARRLGRLLDPSRSDSATRDLCDAVDAEIVAGNVDVVVLTGKDTAAVADVASGRVPLVVDLCDATSSRLTQEIRLASGARRAGLRVRRRGLRKVERHLIAAGDQLLVASARDRVVLARETGDQEALRATVVTNGVDVKYWHRSAPVLGDAVVFCGNLSYRPNADAARELVHRVMPRVWARHPYAEVRIIGTGASPELVNELRRSLVTLTGRVEDVRPHLEAGAVFAAPLRIASGIQNKVLEAMAMELPVVASSVAAAGLVTDGQEPPIEVTDDPATTAAAIAGHLDEVGQGRARPHHEGRAWVAERFRWDRSAAVLAAAIDTACTPELAPC